jgi:glycogen operon protein
VPIPLATNTQSYDAAGRPWPLGATVSQEGVNFSVFSFNATHVQLLLFDAEDSPQASRIIDLDRRTNHTSYYWHAYVPDICAGQLYAYRMDGLRAPEQGHRFDFEKLLLDPYAKAVSSRLYRRGAAVGSGDNEAFAMRSVVVETGKYDWEGDRPLQIPFRDTVIYELHVGGFTSHPNSGVGEGKRGTYDGLVEKIPYLKELGITAVELMPVFHFDEQDAPPGLTNYWGYCPVSFFAPYAGYSSRRSPLGCLDEFREMVKALHRAGLEVILDVVYNHTTEGGDGGPTLSFKGIDNRLYYILSEDGSCYHDYTGTGNTLNTNQPIVRRMIIDSLHYWVSEMHVDGFRFDLASVLNRDERGQPIPNAPVLWDIDSDPVLAGTKLIAEAWDAAGLYQVGSFGGQRWREWNGRFRDDVRRFLKSDPCTVLNLRHRLLGSPDLYAERHLPPEESINFVTCHDGFTLNDLVSFNHKHNRANGEDNRDGMDSNDSWNCGVEGATADASVEQLRARQIRNALTLTLVAVGVPLLLMGDEVRRTQQGNNNAYCQKNEISWFDWDLCRKHSDLHRFVQLLIRLRLHFARAAAMDLSLSELLERARIEWHGVRLGQPDLNVDSHSLATMAQVETGDALYVMLSAYWEPLTFSVPSPPAGIDPWYRVIDSSCKPPEDFVEEWIKPVNASTYVVQPRSVALLIASSRSERSDRVMPPYPLEQLSTFA